MKPEKRQPSRRQPRRIRALIPILAILLLTAGGVVLLLRLVADEKPKDDSDLVPRVASIPDAADNPGLRLIELLKNVPALSPEEESAIRKRSSTLTEEEWNIIGKLVERHGELLLQIRELSELPGWKNPVVYDMLAPIDDYMKVWQLVKIMNVHGQWLLHTGKADAAAAEALALLRLSQRREEGGGMLIHGVFTVGVHQIGQNLLIDILRDPARPSLSDVGGLRRKHAECRLQTDHFADFYRGEYQAMKNAFTNIRDGKLDPVRAAGPLTKNKAAMRVASLFYQHSRTVNDTGDMIRLAIADLQAAPGDWTYQKQLQARFDEWQKHQFRQWFSPNALGNVLTVNIFPSFSGVREAYLRSRTVEELIQIHLAAVEFQRTKNRALVSLGELVPEYLPEVPPDPHDGRPMRLNSKTRRVYSIGSDLIDSHGEFTDPGKLPHQIKEEPALELPVFP